MNLGSLLETLTDDAGGRLNGRTHPSIKPYMDSLKHKLEVLKEKAAPVLSSGMLGSTPQTPNSTAQRTPSTSRNNSGLLFDGTQTQASSDHAARSFDTPIREKKQTPLVSEADFAMHFSTTTPTKGKSSELRYEVRIRDRQPITGMCSIASECTDDDIREAILADIGFSISSRVQEMSAKDSKIEIFDGFNGFASLFSARK